MDVLESLMAERETLDADLEQINERAAAEVRKLTEPEAEQAKALTDRIGVIDERVKMTVAQLEARRNNSNLIEKASGFTPARIERRNGNGQTVDVATPGRLFVESAEFRGYNGHGTSGRVDVDGFLETRAAITTANLAIPHFVYAPVEYQFRSILLEVCGRVTVSSGVVDWVEVGADPVAAVVAEGAAKPEATFTMTPRTAALDTLAHWVQITRQALDDATYIRSLIESKLRRGLLAKAEADMATAIDAAATQTATTSTAAGGNIMKSIRVGIGKVEASGYNPNAVLLNPTDYANLDIEAMAASDTGPVRTSTFWGLTPVASSSITAGKAYVGDFQNGAVLFDRGVTSVFVSDSHASLFISNILVILAEARTKSVVTDPLAICECSVVA